MQHFRKSLTPLRALCIDTLLFGILVGSVLLWWRSTALSTSIVVVTAVVGFVFFHKREDYVFFLVGAILGSVTEIIIIDANVWQYGNPVLFGLALWTPFFWGFAFLFGRRMRDFFFNLSHENIHYTRHARELSIPLMFLTDAALLGLIIIAALLFWQTTFMLVLIYLLILTAAVIVFHTSADRFFIIIAIITGTVLEIVATRAGVWTHANDVLLGMPAWLPIAYGLFALIVRRAAVLLNLFLFRQNFRTLISEKNVDVMTTR